MRTQTTTYTYTHSVNFVTDRILHSFKDIIRDVGLHPRNLTDRWGVLENGIRVWLESRHLETLHLEIWRPSDGKLVALWSFDIDYEYETEEMWEDPAAIRSAITKMGGVPSECQYRIVVVNSDGAPALEGWTSTTVRSTRGMVPQAVGTSTAAPGIGARGSYMRRL